MARKKTEDNADEEVKTTLADFVLPELVDAFCRAYEPLDGFYEGCEVFSYTRLRGMFKAVITPLGDPFILYKQMLSERGFIFVVDIATSEFVIYARAKF